MMACLICSVHYTREEIFHLVELGHNKVRESIAFNEIKSVGT